MTLHISMEISDGKRHQLAGLEHDSLMKMGSILHEFRQKTGVDITEYNDLTLHPDHVILLQSLLSTTTDKAILADVELCKFIVSLKEACHDKAWIIFVGE